ncbi:MAG: hypothetical protein PHU04_04675 [Candidatus Peribacteraceae bacterium]|nr:hypothetical protein [Candidatus Peribacteraceae bacterium]
MFSLNALLFKRHLDDDEQIICVVHKHWLVGFRFLFWPAAVFLGFALLLTVAPRPPVVYVIAGLAAMTIVWGVRNFLDYYLDAWMITDTGIVDVEWHGWFHRESSRVLYSDLQGVSYEIDGLGATLLRYGTLSVEKISNGSEISMEYVPRPRVVEALILKRMETYLHTKNLKDATVVQDLLATVIAREMQMKELRGRNGSSSSSRQER